MYQEIGNNETEGNAERPFAFGMEKKTAILEEDV